MTTHCAPVVESHIQIKKKAVFYNPKKKGGGGWGVPFPVVTKKEFDTTRKQRGEGGVS